MTEKLKNTPACIIIMLCMLCGLLLPLDDALSAPKSAPKTQPIKPASVKTGPSKDAGNKEGAVASEKKPPEVQLENVIDISAIDLVNKPQEYLGKNVRFPANFFAWSNLALDYKPALRSSKTHISFLILRPNSHIPLSELKLAMTIPEDKDPNTNLFATLKDGDQVELLGKVFSTALDEPWVDVVKLKKLSSSSDEKTSPSADSQPENKNKEEQPTKSEKDKSTKPDGSEGGK